MNNTLNFTQAFDINNNSLFSPQCITECNKISDMCSKFQLHVIQTMNIRFIIALMILFTIILFQLYIKYFKPKFSQTELWMNKVDYRIDFVMWILMCFIILYIFMM